MISPYTYEQDQRSFGAFRACQRVEEIDTLSPSLFDMSLRLKKCISFQEV